jgi:hypothetical protein
LPTFYKQVFLHENVLHSFSVLTVRFGFVIFFEKIGETAARKMLVKLSTGIYVFSPFKSWPSGLRRNSVSGYLLSREVSIS